jgi:hypothetical protein
MRQGPIDRCAPSSRPAFVIPKDALVAVDKRAPVIDVTVSAGIGIVQPFALLGFAVQPLVVQ